MTKHLAIAGRKASFFNRKSLPPEPGSGRGNHLLRPDVGISVKRRQFMEVHQQPEASSKTKGWFRVS